MCDRCTEGASGEDGHAALFPYFRSGAQSDGQPTHVLYLCGMCGSVWRRGCREGGNFEWLPKNIIVGAKEPRSGVA